ncbi:MAG: hypothetical protein ACW99A_03865 [Candidatus Kariarchaeaceae archaeon]
MTDECKDLEKKAKVKEKENPSEAIVLYKQASQCFARYDNTKNKNSNLEKAAKLLRETAKSDENPVVALDFYEQASSIYTELEKKAEAEKVMQEAYTKFIKAAKLISSEAGKMEDIYAAEQKFNMASEYAIQGKDEDLSNKFWEESGNQFYKAAKAIQDPREAFEIFKRAILNYRKGYVHEKENLVLTDAADKFSNKASNIYKTRKTLALALDNYDQAITIYHQINSKEKALEAEKKVQEICDRIGMAKLSIVDYLKSQDIKEIVLLESAYISSTNHKRDVRSFESDSEEFVGISEFDKVLESDLVGKGIPDPITSKLDREDSEDEVKPELDQNGASLPAEVRIEISEGPDPVVNDLDIPQPITTVETSFETKDDVKLKPEDSLIIDEIDKMYMDPPAEGSTPELVDEKEEIVDSEMIQQEISEPTPTVETSFDYQDDIKLETEDSLTIDTTDKSDTDQPIESSPQQLVDESEESIDSDIAEKETPPHIAVDETSSDLPDEVKLKTEDSLIIDEIDKMYMDQSVASSPPEMVDEIEESVDSDLIEQEIEPPVTQEEITDDIQDKIEFEPKPSEFIRERIKSEIHQGIMTPPGEDYAEEEKKREIDNLVDDALDESIEDFVSVFEDVSVGEEKAGKPAISGPIIDILREQGYIDESLTTEEELLQVPEYQILLIIIKNHPIPLEELEEKAEISSISLVLSNLQADDLIVQTNDYQWTISQKVKDSVEEFKVQDVVPKGDEDDISQLRSQIVRNSKSEIEFISTMHKLGIIPNPDMSLLDLMEIPEFTLIKTIKDKEPADFEVIKDLITDLPPVQVNRILSRLEADEWISKNDNGLWELSDKFVLALVKDEI